MGSIQLFETKNAVLKNIIKLYDIETLVETGSHIGDSIQYALDDLKMRTVYSCDLSDAKYTTCLARFKNSSNVKLMLASSFDFLEKILPSLDTQESVLFWLDAHLSENKVMPEFREIDYPFEKEMEIIHKYRANKHDVILVDDYYIYESGPYRKHRVFKTQYPEKLVPDFLNKYSYKKKIFMSDSGYLLLMK